MWYGIDELELGVIKYRKKYDWVTIKDIQMGKFNLNELRDETKYLKALL